jgi:hypothetical protein
MWTGLSFDEILSRATAEKEARTSAIERAFAESPAIIMTGYGGRLELVIMTPEMGEPGAQMRVTYFLPDGPRGHATRATRAALVEDVAEYHPTEVRPATEDEVIAWTSTPEYIEGSARVAEIQRLNAESWARSKQTS